MPSSLTSGQPAREQVAGLRLANEGCGVPAERQPVVLLCPTTVEVDWNAASMVFSWSELKRPRLAELNLRGLHGFTKAEGTTGPTPRFALSKGSHGPTRRRRSKLRESLALCGEKDQRPESIEEKAE